METGSFGNKRKYFPRVPENERTFRQALSAHRTDAEEKSHGGFRKIQGDAGRTEKDNKWKTIETEGEYT